MWSNDVASEDILKFKYKKKRDIVKDVPFLYGLFFDYGLRIKTLSANATKVRANSIIKAEVYWPVASSTLFDAVATKEPTITVKVIRAILFEKYFIPKNDDVNAAVIVGHEP